MANGEREYCDLVMKGGIASGVVYPNAALRLSKRFTFKNIGGTSAGAIAAAATAAASLGQRRLEIDGDSGTGDGRGADDDGSADDKGDVGFAGLERVAGQLASAGFIRSLFQPARGGRLAFRFLLRAMASDGLAGKLLFALAGALAVSPFAFLLTLAFLLAIAWMIGGATSVVAASLPALLCALAACAISAALAVGRVLRRNRFGLCPGLGFGRSRRRSQGLTDWLHEVLQSLAAQPAGRPLLFEDLWRAPRYKLEPDTERTISLEMITTDVSHHEPRGLPMSSAIFWFRRRDFEALFPADVVEWMIGEDQAPIESEGFTYYRLPVGGRLPVLVATRMSLSFPLLFSAVPLYERDHARIAGPKDEPASAAAPSRRHKHALESTDQLAAGGGRESDRPSFFRVCWFSDGGISSNFPIHLFDAPLPRWPTFAINLLYSKAAEPPEPMVFLPRDNRTGWQPRYRKLAGSTALSQVVSFLLAIVGTMQNWRDLLQSRAPGHRERIVDVTLAKGEGGLNLDMPEKVLARIARKGASAGSELAESFDFNNHYWVRWRNVAGALERFVISFSVGADAPASESYADAHASACSGSPPPPSYPFTRAQQEIAQRRFNELRDEGELWEDMDPDLSTGAPRPQPELRIVPTF